MIAPVEQEGVVEEAQEDDELVERGLESVEVNIQSHDRDDLISWIQTEESRFAAVTLAD